MDVHDATLREGTQPFVAFIPGLLETADIWQGTVRRLNLPTRRTLFFDLPGHTPGSTALCTRHALETGQWLTTMADDLRNRTGGEKAILVGHSTGGMVALALAHRYPDLVHSVVAVGALTCGRRGRVIDPLAKLLSAKVLGPTAFRTALRFWLSTATRFQMGFRWASSIAPKVGVSNRVRKQLQACDPMALRACAEWVIRTDIGPVLPEIETPVLALIGTEDPVIPPRHQLALIKTAPNAHAQLLRGGHLLFNEAPERLEVALSSWLGLATTELERQN